MTLSQALLAGVAGIVFCIWARTRFQLTDSASKTPRGVVARALVDHLRRVCLWTVIVYFPLALLTSGSLVTGEALGWMQSAAVGLKSAVERSSHVLSDFVLGWLVVACWVFVSSRLIKVAAHRRRRLIDALLSLSAYDTLKRAGSLTSAASLALLLMTLLDLPEDAISAPISPEAIPVHEVRVNFIDHELAGIDHEIARVMAVQAVRALALTHAVKYPLTDAADASYRNRDPLDLTLPDRFAQRIQQVASANPRFVAAMRTKWKKYCSGFSSRLDGDYLSDLAIDKAVDFVFSLSALPKDQLPGLYRDAISGATSDLFKLERDDVDSTFDDIARAKDPRDLDRRLRLDAAKLARYEQVDGQALIALLQNRKFDRFIYERKLAYDQKVEEDAERDEARYEERTMDVAP